jgi:NAD-dependent DNA ligase
MLQEAMAESRAETNVHDIEEMPEDWANTLEAAGYDDLDSVINASVEDLIAIEGVDEEMAQQMIEIARKHEQIDESEPAGDEEEQEYQASEEDGEEQAEEPEDAETPQEEAPVE